MPYLVKEANLEADLIEVQHRPEFPKIVEAYDEMLERLGNIDGNEIIALVILAIEANSR